MKSIKVKFLGFDGNQLDTFAFYRIIKANYNIIESDDPDYIIVSLFGKPYEYCNYPQVRIMYSGENYIPDFNLIDYAFVPYDLKLYDRSFFCPTFANCYERTIQMETIDRNYSMDFVKSKEYFANFIASHESEYNIRGDFFKKLSEYKRIESIGSYLNNMPDGRTVSFLDDSKIQFQKKCKFSLCFESNKHHGFITEKIIDAFAAGTIPIYYGSDTVTEIFNSKAFINCNDFDNFDDVIKRIIELDCNDELYLDMLHQPILINNNYSSDLYLRMENFIKNIFDQPIDKCFRRSRYAWPAKYNDLLAYYGKFQAAQTKITNRHRKKRRNKLYRRKIIGGAVRKILGNERWENIKIKIGL